MMERELTLNNFVLAYARMLAAGLDDATLADIPAPGMNPPLWVYGHLAVVADLGGKILGRASVMPAGWGRAFGPGSDPAAPPSPRPTLAELLAAFDAGHESLRSAVRAATAAQMDAPSPFAPAAKLLPTAGDLIAHMLTTHATLHLGQLSAWRRLKGLPAVLGF
ncbi:MAG: DinB family protein [Gemmataceae bacterium]